MDKELLIDIEQLQNEFEKVVESEQESKFFKTFKGVRGQLFEKCKKIKEKAYQLAYEDTMNDPKLLQQVKDGKITQSKHKEKAEDNGDEASKKSLPSKPLGVALMLREYIRFIRIKPEAQGQEAPLYFYNPDSGVWLEDNEFLEDLIAIISPNTTKPQATDTLYKIARRSTLKTIQNEYTAIGKQLYNTKTQNFQEFSPDIVVTRKIKTGYNPNATEPTINGWKPTAWLLELFDGDRELSNLAVQIIKASITGHSLRKIFWLYGEGGTGKGTFQQLLINLVGMENVASYKIAGTKQNQFTTSILLGKSLVIGDDIQKGAIVEDTSNMFSLATGDIMTIEEKKRKPYSIRLNMTVVQSSNGLPFMKGDKSAIDRRFRILPFTKVFKGNPNKAIKDSYINRKDVLEYLVKLAIETPIVDINPARSIAILEEHHKEMNPVIDFVDQFFTTSLASEFIPNGFVYYCWKGYVNYYNVKQHYTRDGLQREVKQYIPEWITPKSRTIPKGQHLPYGFLPREDLPMFANGTYSNGRESEEKRKKPKNERGYINLNAKRKKRR